ncbi:MAG: hypothetical protein E4H08_09045 [Candidatus Atribacteria bacterium]|nr:MAG: hypothetical protein E4H08_09045 [Candidatus Atribacteria bacterium]
MRQPLLLFLLIVIIGVPGAAAQTWDTGTSYPPEAPFTVLTVLEGYWSDVQFSEDLEQLALRSRRKLAIVDTESGETIVSLTPPSAWIEFTGSPAFNADGTSVACSMTDGNVLIFSTETGEATGTFPTQYYAVFSQDGGQIATQDEPGEVAVWSTETGQLLFSMSEFSAQLTVIPLGFSHDDTFAFALGIPYSGNAITGAWNVATQSLIRVFPGIVRPLQDGSLLSLEPILRNEDAPVDVRTCVSLWESVLGEPVQTFWIPGFMWSSAIDHTGQVLALAQQDGTIHFWNIAEEREIHQLDLKTIVSDAEDVDYDEARIDHVRFSPDGTLLATATWMSGPMERTYVQLWNISELLADGT